MKRSLAALLALCILVLSVPALGEPAPAPDPIPQETPVAIDLDGDGAQETVSWRMSPGQYEDEVLTLTVESADGAARSYATEILWGEVYVADLDGDGAQELLMTGDVMSDDYYTYCLHYDRGALYEVLFPDSGRGDNTDGYFKCGYGMISAIGDNLLGLTGSQDMLGTWFATRTLTLAPSGRFEFNDAGLWQRSLNAADGDDLWDYGALTVAVALPYSDLQGNPAGTLEPGAQIIVTATDKREAAYFAGRDGVSGCLAVSPDYERGWGWLVSDIPEDEYFEFVPYAD